MWFTIPRGQTASSSACSALSMFPLKGELEERKGFPSNFLLLRLLPLLNLLFLPFLYFFPTQKKIRNRKEERLEHEKIIIVFNFGGINCC